MVIYCCVCDQKDNFDFKVKYFAAHQDLKLHFNKDALTSICEKIAAKMPESGEQNIFNHNKFLYDIFLLNFQQ